MLERTTQNYNNYVKNIIDNAIKEDIKVWEQDKDILKNKPYSPIHNKYHSGINSIILEINAVKRGFDNGIWLSKSEIESLGLKIKPEEQEKGTKIALLKRLQTTPKIDTSNEVTTDVIKLKNPILEISTLFNIKQIEENALKFKKPTQKSFSTPVFTKSIDSTLKQNMLNYLQKQNNEITKTAPKYSFKNKEQSHSRGRTRGR